MDSTELRWLSSRKISVAVLIWVILIFLMFLVNQFSRNYQLKREVSKMRKELKTDYEERIKKRELIIQRLEIDNQLKKKEIDKMNDRIDSLNKVKNKIQIKYVQRIQEIKYMDSEQIKKYWDGQFK
jgi:ABC-type multidrug transport system fused ATPase/permease subunit